MKSSSEVREAATLAERERIIKLLEDELLSDDDSAWQTRDWAQVERQQDRDEIVKEAIALIKGQTDCACRPEGQCLYHKYLDKGSNPMNAIRADRNSDIAQQEYADLSNPLIKEENK